MFKHDRCEVILKFVKQSDMKNKLHRQFAQSDKGTETPGTRVTPST